MASPTSEVHGVSSPRFPTITAQEVIYGGVGALVLLLVYQFEPAIATGIVAVILLGLLLSRAGALNSLIEGRP